MYSYLAHKLDKIGPGCRELFFMVCVFLVQSILEDNAAMSSEEARHLINSMKDSGLYHEDIFGVTLKTAEVTTRVRTAAKK